MDLQAIRNAIYAEFVGDADLLAALGGSARRMYPEEAPQDAASPYCTYQYITGVPDPTFTSDGEITSWQFSLFNKTDEPRDFTDITLVFKKLMAAYDDAALTLSGYSSIGVTRGISNVVPTIDGVQQLVVTYEIIVEDT